MSLNHIHRETGISKGTLSYILRIVSKEQILNDPKEAERVLKAYQKGGNRMSEEQIKEARERAKARWERYLEKTLEEAMKRKKSLRDKGEKEPTWWEEGFRSLGGVQIGYISIIHFGERRGVGGEENSLDSSQDTLPQKELFNNGAVCKHRRTDEKVSSDDEMMIAVRSLALITEVEDRWLREFGETPERDGYRRLIFGAVRSFVKGEKKRYELGGWGRYAFILGDVLERLGHSVELPNPPLTLIEEEDLEEIDLDL